MQSSMDRLQISGSFWFLHSTRHEISLLHFNNSICYRKTVLVILFDFFFTVMEKKPVPMHFQHAVMSYTKGSLKTKDQDKITASICTFQSKENKQEEIKPGLP